MSPFVNIKLVVLLLELVDYLTVPSAPRAVPSIVLRDPGKRLTAGRAGTRPGW